MPGRSGSPAPGCGARADQGRVCRFHPERKVVEVLHTEPQPWGTIGTSRRRLFINTARPLWHRSPARFVYANPSLIPGVSRLTAAPTRPSTDGQFERHERCTPFTRAARPHRLMIYRRPCPRSGTSFSPEHARSRTNMDASSATQQLHRRHEPGFFLGVRFSRMKLAPAPTAAATPRLERRGECHEPPAFTAQRAHFQITSRTPHPPSLTIWPTDDGGA